MSKDNKEQIQKLKYELESLITEKLEEGEENNLLYYQLTPDQIYKLDNFFNKTYEEVIQKFLLKMKNRMLQPQKIKKWNTTIKVEAIEFPNSHHKNSACYYLADKYREKLEELGLMELGITDISLSHINEEVPSNQDIKINYEEPNAQTLYMNNRFIYGLVISYDVRKSKQYQKSRTQ